ncbi:hypothetical protein CDAR_375211 [Caerostris darwini]|uniref:Uncharacterized protein n=1 Tax=Caerostris darwini TaxID=1538125 RepID=A0AAV4R787_9ARAC|nr:hypothetical protein CDAR_375211 [Caerostris darwini]
MNRKSSSFEYPQPKNHLCTAYYKGLTEVIREGQYQLNILRRKSLEGQWNLIGQNTLTPDKLQPLTRKPPLQNSAVSTF